MGGQGWRRVGGADGRSRGIASERGGGKKKIPGEKKQALNCVVFTAPLPFIRCPSLYCSHNGCSQELHCCNKQRPQKRAGGFVSGKEHCSNQHSNHLFCLVFLFVCLFAFSAAAALKGCPHNPKQQGAMWSVERWDN